MREKVSIIPKLRLKTCVSELERKLKVKGWKRGHKRTGRKADKYLLRDIPTKQNTEFQVHFGLKMAFSCFGRNYLNFPVPF